MRHGREGREAASSLPRLADGTLLRSLELVLDDVSAGLLVRPIQRRLQKVRIIELGDRLAGNDPEPMRLAPASVELTRVMHGQLLVGSVDVAGVDHRVALVLLPEDLPDAPDPFGSGHRAKGTAIRPVAGSATKVE